MARRASTEARRVFVCVICSRSARLPTTLSSKQQCFGENLLPAPCERQRTRCGGSLSKVRDDHQTEDSLGPAPNVCSIVVEDLKHPTSHRKEPPQSRRPLDLPAGLGKSRSPIVDPRTHLPSRSRLWQGRSAPPRGKGVSRYRPRLQRRCRFRRRSKHLDQDFGALGRALFPS